MKTQIEIITGFLGAGKTTHINKMLKSRPLKERTVVIQCEAGEKEIDEQLLKTGNLHLIKLHKESPLQPDTIKEIIKKYLPHKIIIEHNGMTSLEEVLDIVENKSLHRLCETTKVVQVIDATTFDLYMNNMGTFLVEQAMNSDTVILNNDLLIPEEKIKSIQKTLKSINKFCDFESTSTTEAYSFSSESAVAIDNTKGFEKPTNKILAGFFFLVLVYLAFMIYRSMDTSIYQFDFTALEDFNTIFLSIIIQAFPFILVGVFISSIIQVFVSNETIVRLFPKNKFGAFFAAILAGVFFPVCDCGIVPVASRLARKGVPLSAAITFMLAAPIVNPIVVASTFYAFAGQPEIAFYRVFLGIIIAVTVGAFISVFPEEGTVFNGWTTDLSCNCGCSSRNLKNKNLPGKLGAVIKHAESEFFEVGQFLVVGAFLSTLTQTLIPKEVLGAFAGGYVVPLLVMMGAAFVLSICSTSDAFIAKSFLTQFSPGAVMGFMVLGAMLDIKNLLMLLGSFKKRFVIKLVLIISVVSFSLLYFFGAFM